jgi:dipeptidyl aminopeptidase/acylaminoacyl peptidase
MRACLVAKSALAFGLPFAAVSSITAEETPAKRPLTLADTLAWKAIGPTAVSPDGKWVGYRYAPNEGDSEIVIRETRGTKEYRFPTGEVALPDPVAAIRAGTPPPQPTAISFSEAGGWAAFSVFPTRAQAAQLRRQRRPLQNAAALVNLATGEKTEFPKTRRFAFSGEDGRWLALHRYGPEPTPGAGGSGASGGAAGGAGAAGGGAGQDRDRPRGADLVLRDLEAGVDLNIGNVADFTFDKAGRHLAFTIDAPEKAGNGIQLRILKTGATLALDSDKASYERPTWTENGDGLAVVRGREDRKYEDKLYDVLGFTGFESGKPQKIVYKPADDASFPAGFTISPNRSPRFTEDLQGLLFGIHTPKPKRADADKPSDAREGEGGGQRAEAGAQRPEAAQNRDDEKPDLVLWHWKDERLQSQQEVQENRDKSFSYFATYRIQERKFIRLADDALRDVHALPKDRWGFGTDEREYDLMEGLDGRRYQDIYTVDLTTGQRKLAAKKIRWSYPASPDGNKFLYYDDGHYFVYDIPAGKATNVTRHMPVSFVNVEDDHNNLKPPVPPMGWSRDSASVLLTDAWDVWKVPVSGGAAANLTVSGRSESVRYRRRFQLDPDEKGIDLTAPLFLASYAEWTKKGGVVRVDAGQTGVKTLVGGDVSFARLLKAKKAEVFVYTRESSREYPDLYVADALLREGKRITDGQSQLEPFAWSAGVRLVDYTSAKGDRLQGALFLPADYQPGKRYPTIVYIYERLSQGAHSFDHPSANGFDRSVYTSNGYAVLTPDIKYRVNDPGMSAVWCVLPALEAAIASGVVDRARVGLQGHSWGGYQTSFLVTQTNAFAAAVAGAPLTNMISMYGIIYKNTGGGNGAIFESSQGRFFGGPWDHWQAYVRNSPVAHAKNVRTPLVILHNDKDGAVDFTQGVEYYTTLRRLQKPVVMLQYVGENHGLRKPANQQDYSVRMREFFDHHLKGAPAPDWWTQGVPRLKLEEHLRERAKDKDKKPKPAVVTDAETRLPRADKER